MPFSLTNAPAVFQALVNDVLRDTFTRFLFGYTDDVLISSRASCSAGLSCPPMPPGEPALSQGRKVRVSRPCSVLLGHRGSAGAA